MISVCMATYNGERYVKKQIDSIICQLSSEDELIISDDGSNDGTLEIICSYRNPQIKIFHHKRNERLLRMKSAAFRLAADNFANALDHAQGDYIFLSDQDDIWNENKINIMSRQLQYFDLVMCNLSIIDSKDNIQCYKFLEKDPVSMLFLKNLYNTPFLGCTMAFPRKVLTYCLPFPKGVIGHDLWMGCLICVMGTYKYIEEPLHYYRKHDLNVSPATSKSNNSIIFKISYRIIFVLQILARYCQHLIGDK